jgi:hypothetical protein
MKYILYTILCFSLVSMKNFHNNLDLSSDLEIVENFDTELMEDLNVDLLVEIESIFQQERANTFHICKFHGSSSLDVQNPPPEF